MVVPHRLRVADRCPRILADGGDRGLRRGGDRGVRPGGDGCPARRCAVVAGVHPHHDRVRAPGIPAVVTAWVISDVAPRSVLPFPPRDRAAGMVRACTAFPAIKASVRASASVLIAARPRAVWDVVWSPETTPIGRRWPQVTCRAARTSRPARCNGSCTANLTAG